jgi:acid phosphatase type 7
MTTETPGSGRRQTTTLVVLGLAAVLLIGTVVGFLLGGGGDATNTATTAVSVTTTFASTLPPTTAPTTPTTTTASASTSTEAPTVEEFVFAASEDTVVDSDDPVTVLAASEVLDIEQDGPDDERRALLRFAVDGLPPGIPITSAMLRLTLVGSSSQVGLVNLVGGPWTESQTTWENAPPLGDPIAPLPGGVEGTQVDIDVTDVVTGPGQFDFYLTLSSPDGMDFASRESPSGVPAMIVTVGEEGSVGKSGMVLAGAGDIASCSSEGDEATAALLDQVVDRSVEAVVFTAGDNAYEDGSEQSFNDCYDPSWGRHMGITRPAPGSREYRTPGASGYFGYFGAAAGDPTQGYYSYEFGGWHIVALNSNCTEIGGCEAGSPQEQWLRQDLAAVNTQCTAAYWHQPLFSSRSGGTNPEMVPLFQALFDATADVVISGNDHFYERFLPQTPSGEDEGDGITQFTAGTGGRSLDEYGGPTRNSAVRYNQSFGVLALTLLPDGFEWEFLTPPDTPFTDAGSAACN